MKSDKSPRKTVKKGSTTTGHVLKEALRKGDAQLNAIVTTSPVPMFVIDDHHRIISWNRALENTTGIEAPVVLGTSMQWKLFYDSERPCLADLLVDGLIDTIPEPYTDKYRKSEIVEGAYEATDFFPHLGKSGKWLHFVAAPIRDRNGRLIGAAETLEDITGLVQAQQELKESEQQYRSLFENANEGLLFADIKTGKFVHANPAICRMLGYSNEEFITMSVADIHPKESLDNVMEEFKKLETGERNVVMDIPCVRKDGTICIMNIASSRVMIQGKLCLAGFFTDITEHKRAENALRVTQEKYTKAFLLAPDAITISELESGRFIEVNDAACNIYGFSREELIGRSATELDIWLRREDRDAFIEQVISQGRVTQYERVERRKSGELITVSITADTMVIGSIRYLIAVIRDITERKKAEQELNESESRYNALFANNYSVSLLIDPDTGRIIDANEAAARYYGYSRDQLTAMGIQDLNRLPEDKVVRNLKRAKNEREKHFLSTHYRADGEKRNVEIYSGPITVQGKPLFYSIIHDITDRRLTEQALKESESRYSALFTNNYSVSLLIDPDTGRITDANEAAVRYYGYSHDQLTAMGIYDLNRLPEDTVVRNLKRAKGEKEKHFFSTHYRADGEKRYVEVYSGPIRVQGKPLFYSIIHDITERKTAEEALRHSEATLKVILQSSPIPKFVIDDNHRVISWNTSLEETTGIKAQDVIGTTQHWRAFYPTARPCIADLLVDSDERKLSLLYTGKYKKSDVMEGAFEMTDFFPNLGESGRWLRAIAAPIIDSKGKVIGAVETLEDITRLTKAQQSLKESEERYRTLVDQLPDYVLVHRDGILLYVNPAAASRFGYPAETLIGKPLLQFIAPEYHGAVREAIALRMAGREVPAYEMMIKATGTYRTVLTNGSVINYEGRTASLNVLSDITDRKLMEEEVRSLNRVLEQRVKDRTEALSRANEQLTAEIAARARAEQEIVRSLQEKDLLLREIHHRVKNNLQIIASLLNLQSRTIADPNVLEAIKNSQSRIRAMALVHERIYRSHNIAEINLKDYLSYLTKQIFQFYNIQQHQIGIEVTMGTIMADIDTITPLGLIMNELVSNSLKYAFPDSRKGTISIGCTEQDADMLRIVYHDNGIGMPSGFDWKNSESLGLQLVNSLVDQLNGTIESGGGEGTTFIITIQQKRDSSPA